MLSGVTLITPDPIGDVLIAGSPFEGQEQELAASNNLVDADGLGPIAPTVSSSPDYSPDYTTINGRNFGYYVPESYDPSTPTPLLFMFHGMGGNSSEQSGGSAENGYYGWQTTAHENEFIVLFPESLGFFKTWDLGAGGTSSDLSFVDDMIDWADTNYNISTSQIFTTGHSWGAYFSYYVARYRSDDIAAFATHSGGLGGSFFLGSTPPVPTGPSPTPTLNGIVLHAVDDGLVPYSNSQDLYDDLMANGHNVYNDGIGDDGIIEVDGWGPDNHRYRLQHNQTQWDFFLEVTDDEVPLVLNLAVADASIAEGAGAAATTATVTRSDPRGNLTVTLTSDDMSEAIVPATVTMLDGESSATVDIAAVDDSDVDGTQAVTLSAAAADYAGDSATLQVTDDDVPLVLNLAVADASIAEGAGAAATTATVTRSDPRGNLTVTLTSDDMSEAIVPATVTMLDGESSATVDIAAVDDSDVDGTQAVTLSAAAADYAGDSATLQVTDDDVPLVLNLAVADASIAEGAGAGIGNRKIQNERYIVISHLERSTIPGVVRRGGRKRNRLRVLNLAVADASIAEGAGAAATTATVTRSDPRGNLTVTLTSDDMSEAIVPATVTMLDGESSATVDIAAVDDSDVDGTQAVTLSAAAADYAGDSSTLQVTDDDVPVIEVLDNGDSGFTQTGFTPQSNSQVATAYGGDNHNVRGDSGTANWTFTGLEDGEYQVAATWAHKYNNKYNALDAAFGIENDSGTVLASTTVNQKNAPSGFAYEGYSWDTLGTVNITGGTLVVTLGAGSNSNQYTVADAIRIERIGNVSPTLTLSLADASVSEAAGAAATSATVTRTDTNGDLTVTLTSDNVSEATVPATVTILDGESSATVDIAAVDDSDVDGTQAVTLSATATGYTGASDTLQVTDDEASLVTILNNGDAGFTQTGFTPQSNSQVATAYGGDNHNVRGDSGTANWTFTGLEDGEYQVAATWAHKYNNKYNALDAAFGIENDSGTVLASTTVNQKNAPSGFAYEGYSWDTLGTVNITGGTLVVTLGAGSNSNQYTVADAIRIERIGNVSAARGTTIVDASETDEDKFDGLLTAAKIADAAFSDL